MTRRAAIYTRFSSDMQNPKSCADQEAMARTYAKRHGYDVVAAYSDEGISGTSMIGRDGLTDLLADARAGLFNYILIEEINRMSRDQADMQWINKRLKFAGVQLVTLSNGVNDEVSIMVRGLVAQLQSQDMGPMIRRAAAGRVAEGLVPAGVAYGYQKDPLNRGQAVIFEAEAAVVRRIYADTLRGLSPRQIAQDLNAESIPAPRGSALWQGGTIRGWEQRGTGILRNPIYAGTIIYNRQRWLKDPDTGRRVSRLNAAADIVTSQAPGLRIVDHEAFTAVQALVKGKAKTPRQSAAMKRPKYLLSGLLRCGACGGGMSTTGRDKFGRIRVACSTHRETRTCPAPHTFRLDKIEALAVATLRQGLSHPAVMAEYVKTYNDERQKLAREAAGRRTSLEKKAATLDAQLERMVRQLAEGIGDERRIGNHMRTLQAELDQVLADIATEPATDIMTLHPATIARYEAQLGDLQHALEAGLAHTPANSALLRALLHSITIKPTGVAGGLDIFIQGNLRLLLEGTPTATVGGKVGCGGRI